MSGIEKLISILVGIVTIAITAIIINREWSKSRLGAAIETVKQKVLDELRDTTNTFKILVTDTETGIRQALDDRLKSIDTRFDDFRRDVDDKIKSNASRIEAVHNRNASEHSDLSKQLGHLTATIAVIDSTLKSVSNAIEKFNMALDNLKKG